jgi:hypothetical protein
VELAVEILSSLEEFCLALCHEGLLFEVVDQPTVAKRSPSSSKVMLPSLSALSQ